MLFLNLTYILLLPNLFFIYTMFRLVRINNIIYKFMLQHFFCKKMLFLYLKFSINHLNQVVSIFKLTLILLNFIYIYTIHHLNLYLKSLNIIHNYTIFKLHLNFIYIISILIPYIIYIYIVNHLAIRIFSKVNLNYYTFKVK